MPLTASFEVFPPRSLPASFKLWSCAQSVSKFAPQFISVTSGAGGSSAEISDETTRALCQTGKAPVAAHITCVGATQDDILARVDRLVSLGVRDIVALRGDAPNKGPWTPHPGGFASSVDLVAALAARGDVKIHVGAYPEQHPDAASAQDDLTYLKAKFDAGASSAITQFFFEAGTFLRFRDRCADAGITAPIVPGILPIVSFTGAQKMARTCGATLPDWLVQTYAQAQIDEAKLGDERQQILGTALATELCSDLITGGVEHLHFYTLNAATMCNDICMALGLHASGPDQISAVA